MPLSQAIGSLLEEAVCRSWFLLFVGPPLTTALLLLLLLGPIALATLRTGRFPPPGYRLRRPIRTVYGFRARFRAYLLGGVVALLIGLSLWGASMAKKAQARLCPPAGEGATPPAGSHREAAREGRSR